MLVRIGPDGVELTGRTLHVTEAMLSLPQPINYTCIARNQVEMANQQPQPQRMNRGTAKTHELHEVKSHVAITVGNYSDVASNCVFLLTPTVVA